MPSNTVQSLSDVSVVVPTFSQVIDVLTLQAGFNTAVVVLGTFCLGIAAGTIGAFALLRNRALMGDALAHSALPGLAIAFIFGSVIGIGGKQLWLLLLGAAVSGVLGVVCVQLLSRYTRLHEETAIGAVLGSFFGAGVVLMSLIQSLGTGEEGGLHHFIFGQTAAMNRSDALLTLAAALFAIAVCVVLFKEFRLISFDRGFAAAEGWPVAAVDLIMMSVVVLVTVIGLQAVGLLLIISLLIIPPTGARFWTDRLRTMVLASAVIGGMSCYIGASASALLPRLPAGAVIVLVAGAIFLLSFFLAPARGLLARLISRFRMSLRISEDHFLRRLYEQHELQKNNSSSTDFIDLSELMVSRSWSLFYRTVILALLKTKGLIERATINGKPHVLLRPEGVSQAVKRVRSHRLWEEYLATQTHLPLSHIDYSADFAEHFLSKEIIEELEQSRKHRGETLDTTRPPKSLHPLDREG